MVYVLHHSGDEVWRVLWGTDLVCVRGRRFSGVLCGCGAEEVEGAGVENAAVNYANGKRRRKSPLESTCSKDCHPAPAPAITSELEPYINAAKDHRETPQMSSNDIMSMHLQRR